MSYLYDPNAEEQITDRLRPWDNRLDLGDHDVESDESNIVLPAGYSFNCPEGCGSCQVEAYQFYTYTSWNTRTKEFEAGRYHKVYAASCHPESFNPVGVWNDVTDEDAGCVDDFITKMHSAELIKEFNKKASDKAKSFFEGGAA